MLGRGQRRLARFDPGAPVGNGRQFATPDTAEETEHGADHGVTRKQSNVSAEDASDSLSETAIRPDDHERPRRQDFRIKGFQT